MSIGKIKESLTSTIKESVSKEIAINDISKVAELGAVKPSNYRTAILRFKQRIRTTDYSYEELSENDSCSESNLYNKSINEGVSERKHNSFMYDINNSNEIAEEAVAYLTDYGITEKNWELADHEKKQRFLETAEKIFAKNLENSTDWHNNTKIIFVSDKQYDCKTPAFSKFYISVIDDKSVCNKESPELIIKDELLKQRYSNAISAVYREMLISQKVYESGSNWHNLVNNLEVCQSTSNFSNECVFSYDFNSVLFQRELQSRVDFFMSLIGDKIE